MNDVLNRLAELLEQRKSADPTSSYVAKLYAKGMDSILKKIGEEATETVIAAKGRQQRWDYLWNRWFMVSYTDYA